MGVTDGRGIIGALNFLADTGANSIYFLPNNVDGDGDDTFPTIARLNKTRYDVSKLDQWEIVFTHAERLGILLHFVLAETESGNENYHDNGRLGPQRRLYYRELIARFGHHLGVAFNIGEENDYSTARRKEFAEHLKAIDPYDHLVTSETRGNRFNEHYAPLLGDGNFDITSFQGGPSRSSMANLMIEWRQRSAQTGEPWVISFDEPQGIQNSNTDNIRGYTSGRQNRMWPLYMSGGGGFEWYVQEVGGAHTFDQRINDFNLVGNAMRWTGNALDFFDRLDLSNMSPNHNLGSAPNGETYVLATPGELYALYNDRSGANLSLNLRGVSGTFPVRWYDPVNGGDLQTGTVTEVQGGGVVSLGEAPSAINQDWAVLVGATDPVAVSPSISITSPANGDELELGVPVVYTARFSEAESIESIQLFLDSNRVATVTDIENLLNNEVSLTISPTSGVHVLRAVATDSSGDEFTDSIQITVLNSTSNPPSTQTFMPDQDVYIQGSTVFNNTGLRVEHSRRTRVTYMRFEISGIPDNATIENASLTLQESGDRGNGTLRFFRGSNSLWTESSITSINAPAVQEQIASFTGTIATNQELEVDVGSLISGNGVYTIVVQADAGGNDIMFGSRESQRPPILNITTR